jgi:hypothetical protein
MTPKTQVEVITKCRRFFYDKSTGIVKGVASGGGALEALTGDALIMATYNDPDAPDTIGLISCYFQPLGKGSPYSVNLSNVAAMISTSEAYHDNRTDANAQALCEARDACVSYVFPE